MTARGLPFVFAAASGAGKTTLSRLLLNQLHGIGLSISYTTRQIRGREVDGVDYHFVDEPTFRGMIDDDDFVEWARVHDNYYGSSAAATEQRLAAGVDVLFDIDVQGGEQLKKRFPETVLIWIDAPSWQELERRLRGRGTDSPEAIARRLHNARQEQARARLSFDHFVVNEDLQRALRQLLSIVEQARLNRAAPAVP